MEARWVSGDSPSTRRRARHWGTPSSCSAGLESSVALPSLSADGTALVFRSETVSVNPYVLPFDPETEVAGEPREVFHQTGRLQPSDVSPDGEWLVLFNLGESQEDVFIARTDGTELRRLTDDPARDRMPRFSPDGSLITFMSNRDGAYACYSIRPDGSALSLLAEGSEEGVFSAVFEPGGERLLVASFDAYSVLADPPFPVVVDSARALRGSPVPPGQLTPTTWSPDGAKLIGGISRILEGGTYGWGESGFGVFDMETGEGRVLGTDEREAKWLPDSQRVIHLTSEGLVVTDVESGDRRLVPVDLPFPQNLPVVAVSKDGTAIYYGAERVESNIWMVELGRNH